MNSFWLSLTFSNTSYLLFNPALVWDMIDFTLNQQMAPKYIGEKQEISNWFWVKLREKDEKKYYLQ